MQKVSKKIEKLAMRGEQHDIMDALRVIDDDKVNIYMNDSKSPCLIKDAEETFTYIILPININPDAY